MIDTHCHLASRYGPDDLPALLTRAQQAGLTRAITLATGPDDLADTLALTQAHPDFLSPAFGIHPCDVTHAPSTFEETASLLTPYLQHPSTAAIGETGLDYYHPAPEGWEEGPYHQRQRDQLEWHFELASRHQLNLVIHTRDRAPSRASLDDALTIYRQFHRQVRAVFHCFPGPAAFLDEVLALGGLVSFTGNVTFKKALAVQEAARHCPLDALMLETDAPFLTPEPHRGQRNEPAHLQHIARKIADLRDLPLADLLSQTTATAHRFFRLSTSDSSDF